MSTFGTLIGKASAYAQAFQMSDITSDRMRTAIQLWFDLYFQTEPSKEEDPCQRIPYTVVNKLTKTVFSEHTVSSKDAFADGILLMLDRRRAEAMQMALIGGECYLKPVIEKDSFRFVVIPRCNVLIFGRDAEGNVTDVGTAEVTVHERYYYTLLERRTVDEKGYLTIRNRLFRSYSKDTLGVQVGLGELPAYAELQEEYTFTQPVGSVGLITTKTPMVNCVDGSADGVSAYAAAVGLISNINRNEAQLNGEFRRGESKVIVSADMLVKGNDGKATLKDDLFVGLDEDPEATGITIFNPTLREASFLALKQEYLRNVESLIGLKRGLLSEVEAAERTATEITSSAGEYNLAIIDFQRMWEKTIYETVRVCGILGQLYKVPAAHEVDPDAITISWGNGVLYDEKLVYEELKEQVALGLLQPERLVGWYHNRPCDTPAERAKIREEYMPEVPVEDE